MLKYCGDELDPKSRTMLDYHPVEVARQMALAARADFVLVRSSELISRAWMKDAADLHARNCPNIKRIIISVHRISRCVASELVRVTDDAEMRLSMPKRFIELAHCCSDVHRTCTRACTPSASASTSGPCSGSRASGRSCRPSGRSATAELDQLCNAKSRCAAALRAQVGVTGV
jgi:hypothetical protein